jgi:hypothetical protein
MSGLVRTNERWVVIPFFAAALCYWLFFALHWNQTGWDFPAFYTAAHVPTASLYSRTAFAAYWQQHLDSTLLAMPVEVMFGRGSTWVRRVCVGVLMRGPAWRFLLTHVAVEVFFLAFVLRLVLTSGAAVRARALPVSARAAHA